MKTKIYSFCYYNYKSSFIAGATSCISFLGAYPTTFVNNYISFLNEEEKDAHDIYCDWNAVGKDMMNGQKRFVIDYLNGREHKYPLATT